MQKSSFKLEKKLYERGYDFVAGIDEAGRGPLAGPVVACATTVRNFQFLISNSQSNPNDKLQITKYNLIRDSKTLSERQRENLYDFIMENFFAGVGICDHKTIDRMNILQASFLAMKAAITDLKSQIQNSKSQINPKSKIQKNQDQDTEYIIPNTKYIILVDGDKEIPSFSGEQMAIPQGDQKIKSISAASIVAKVTRDRIMREAHKKYPLYGFSQHKGYGTKIHMEMLREFGPCEIHRRSFKPVKNC